MESENFHDTTTEEITDWWKEYSKDSPEVGWDVVSFDKDGFTLNLGPIIQCFYCGVKQVRSKEMIKCAACGGSLEVEEIEIPNLDLDWYRFTYYSEQP